MSTFVSNGTTLYYEEEGHGTPLLLLHGLNLSLMMFEKEMKQLKEHFRVIALDFRGHGKSDRPASFTLEDHIHDVVALMDHLGIESAHILGVSMGSYVGQGITIGFPSRVKKLILVVTKSNGKTSSMQELYDRHAEEVAGLDIQEKFKYVTKYMFHDLTTVEKWLKQLESRKGMLTSKKEQEIANKALVGFDFRPDLHKIAAKTLIISGKHDGVNPPERGKEVASLISNSTFLEFEKSGHLPNLEEPTRFMNEVMNFIS